MIGQLRKLADHIAIMDSGSGEVVLLRNAADCLERLWRCDMSNIRAIRTGADYTAALARIDALMDAELGTPEGEVLDVLTDLVELYESKHPNCLGLGDRVFWFRSGKPYRGHMCGYVTAIIPDDGRGSIRLRVRSNGHSYVLLPVDLKHEDRE